MKMHDMTAGLAGGRACAPSPAPRRSMGIDDRLTRRITRFRKSFCT